MAIESQFAKLLLALNCAGSPLGRVLMLGRQNYLLRPKESQVLYRKFGKTPGSAVTAWPQTGFPYAEPFLKDMGARQVDSMDAAPYEGANILHDLNEPLKDPGLVEGFDTVIDGGTLEHVFNFGQGLVNAMRMVKIGGFFLASAPANNWLGHGFYQLGPEVFYRALSPENGFSHCWVILAPESMDLSWYLAADPKRIRGRTNLINSVRTDLLVIAIKERTSPEQLKLAQSDYEPFWEKNEARLNHGKRQEDSKVFTRIKNLLFETCPALTLRLRTLDARSWHREYRLGRKDIFQPVTPQEIASMLSQVNRR